MTSCIFDIVVDRMIVSRNRLEGGGVCICECAARGAENVADAKVLKPSWRYNSKVYRIEVLRGCLGRTASTLICDLLYDFVPDGSVRLLVIEYLP